MSRAKAFNLLRQDERGVSALEFALVLPIVTTLLLGIIDFGTGISQQFSLHQAVNRSLEIVQANRVAADAETGVVDYGFLKTEVTTAQPGATVTMDQWLECNGARAGNFNDTCADGQETARYLQLRATRVFRGKIYLKPVTLVAQSAVRVQ